MGGNSSMWIDLFRISTFLLFFSYTTSSQAGEDCEVIKREGNKTYRDIMWCDYGCCQDEDQTEPCCDEQSALSQGMVYGVVIVVAFVVMALCVYIRLKTAIRAAKRNNPNQPITDDGEPAPGVVNPEQEPPPPYWMCMTEVLPQNVTTVPLSTDTPPEAGEPRQDRPSSNVPGPEQNIVSEDNVQYSADSATVTPEHVNVWRSAPPALPNIRDFMLNGFSERSTDLSQGVVLHASSLDIPSSSPSSVPGLCRQESEPLSGLSKSGGSGKEGTVVMVLPGHLSADVRQSILQSSQNSQVLFCKTMQDGESGSSREGSSFHSSGLADCFSSRTDVSSSVAPPSYEACSSGVGELSVFKESSLAEILKRLLPGTVVIFENNGNTAPRN